MELLYGVRILAVSYFVLSQSTRLTDGRTDRQKGDSNTVRMHSQSYNENETYKEKRNGRSVSDILYIEWFRKCTKFNAPPFCNRLQ